MKRNVKKYLKGNIEKIREKSVFRCPVHFTKLHKFISISSFGVQFTKKILGIEYLTCFHKFTTNTMALIVLLSSLTDFFSPTRWVATKSSLKVSSCNCSAVGSVIVPLSILLLFLSNSSWN